MEESIYKWLTFLLPPISSIVTWAATKYTRKSTTLQTMQDSIDMLVKKNSELYEWVTALRKENAELKAGQTVIRQENAELKKQIESLKRHK